eukprot:3126646-Prymnesium_polylepis.1
MQLAVVLEHPARHARRQLRAPVQHHGSAFSFGSGTWGVRPHVRVGAPSGLRVCARVNRPTLR